MIALIPQPDQPSADCVDCFIATGTAIALAAAASAASSIAAAKMNSNSAHDAATVQGASNDKALAFEQQKDAEDRAQFEATQRANYDQYLNRYNAAKGLGAEYGLNLPEAKPYVTTTNGSQPTGSTPSASSAMPQGIDPRFAAVYQQYGVTPQGRGSGPADWQYWQNDAVKNANGDVNYVLGRLQADLQRGGSAPARPASASTFAQPVAAYLPQTAAAPTPALSAPAGFRLRGVDSFLR